MFYSDFVLSKKGPLARIWLAAHWDKKLTKAQIFETNIESSIEKILRPKMKLALRTSGHLMLGVVRIYSRKTKYLLADCNEAFVKIKMAFRPGMVDLPDDHREAAANAVTLPEVFHDFDAVMPDLNNLDIEVQFNLNQSRADEITMREDYGSVLPLNTEDTFDLGFDVSSSEVLRHSVGFDQSAQQDNLLFGEGIDSGERNKSTDMNPSLELMSMDVDLPKDDGFGAISGAGAGLFEGGLFEDAPMPSLYFSENKGTNVTALPSTSREQEESRLNENDDFDDNFGALSPSRQSSIGSPSHSPCPDEDLNEALRSSNSQGVISEEPMEPTLEPTNSQSIDEHQNAIPQNEEESFALAPVNTSTLVGSSKTRRKRKLIVDEVKNLSGEEMKGQLSDTTDIVTTLDLAPPTKRLMRWKETGGVEKLFTLSGKMIPSTILYKNYQRHLVSMNASNEDPKSGDAGSKETDDDGVFVVPTVQLPLKRGRKRKRPAVEESTQDIVLENQNANQFQFGYSEELPDSMESKVKAENHASLKHENDQNKRFQSSYDTSISNSETNSKQYSDENNHLNSGMNPWYTAEHNNSQNKMQNEIAEGYSVPLVEDAINLQNNDENASIKDVASSWQNTEYNAENQNTNVYSSPGSNVDHAMTPCTNLDNSITPWHDVDYFNPLPDETPEQQGDNETMEQFEERILNKRASHLYSTIRIRISTGIMTTLNDLTIGNVKKQVAQKFYSLLVLKKHKVLELTQETPYDEVLLSKGTNFDDPKL